MYYFLLSLLILDAILLMTVVLLQAGKGGGLAAMGAAGAGSDTLFGSRQAATLLTRATWWTGGLFIGLSFILSLMSGGTAARESILREGLQAPPQATSPALPGTVEQPETPGPAPTEGTAPTGQPPAAEEPPQNP